jgi:hypothetical protein
VHLARALQSRESPDQNRTVRLPALCSCFDFEVRWRFTTCPLNRVEADAVTRDRQLEAAKRLLESLIELDPTPDVYVSYGMVCLTLTREREVLCQSHSLC